MKTSALLAPASLLLCLSLAPAEGDPSRVLPPDQKPADSRLGKVRTLNDKDFFLKVPPTLQAWEKRRQAVREQVLVANGLWPLPPKTPLNPVIHGKIEKEGYTIEKVFFASHPGHYVSGNLYRPTGKKGPLAGVLCPHGHWPSGRFFEAKDDAVKKDLDSKAEQTKEGARYPLQARCAQLARMGCVVFHYDMVGNADSTQIGHRAGFLDAEAELRLQNFMGLQTWNSIRSLDFLLGLPDVDPKRIGVTGASGGGTQTFILCGIDDRPTVAFPAVMVSTQMQGGCICENCSYLRQGTGNIELAGLFAPKPLAMSGANDWTIDIEKKGLPELKELYRLHGVEDKVMAKCYPQFGHNYNQVARELMYNWFNKHLNLGQPDPVVEKPFEPVPPQQLKVYDEQHPRPQDAVDASRLRQYLTEASDKQIAALRPLPASPIPPEGNKDEKKTLAEYRRVLGTALRVMVNDQLPSGEEVEAKNVGDKEKQGGLQWRQLLLSRKGQGEQVPAIGLRGEKFGGTVVVWVHPEGKKSLWQDGKLVPAAQQVLDRGAALLAIDAYGTGELQLEKPLAVNEGFAGYTFGYNRPLLAQRIHDILTAVAYARSHDQTKTVHLAGIKEAGPWVLLARALCGDTVSRTAADADGFRFEKVTKTSDEMMLPGALKYGGLEALAALAAPGELLVSQPSEAGVEKWLKPVYKAAGASDNLQVRAEKIDPAKASETNAVTWLLR